MGMNKLVCYYHSEPNLITESLTKWIHFSQLYSVGGRCGQRRITRITSSSLTMETQDSHLKENASILEGGTAKGGMIF